jgi:ribosomal-protein-alanine N-acetyltransferase
MIARAGPAHCFVLAAIHAAAFPGGEAWGVAMLAAQLGQPGVFGLLDEAGGMILVRVAADEAEILTLAVAPEARRAGLGRALLDAACAAARQGGATRLFLEVAATNAAARGLYGAAGFRQIGLRRRYYADGTDALMMSLALTSGAAQDG